MSVWWQALKSSRQCAAEARVGHCMMRLFIINLVCILGAWAQNLGGEALGKESKVHVHGIQLRAVVTACDKGYFESAENLVASVQLYEPGMPIFVYDLGLTANQRQIVSSWTGVSLIAIDWTTLPAHMMQLKHCAWKPAVIKDAVERVDSVLYLDAGLELRWDLEPIKADMEEIGYWLILDKQNLEKFVHPSQYDALGVERGAFRNDVGLAAGMIGFSKLSRAWTTLFLPWHNCCMNPLCISPEGSSLSNHRYDQSALSILLYKRMHEEEVYRVVVSERFWASNSTLGGIGTRLDCPTTRIKGLVFYCRRKTLPKPFSPLILYKDTVESSANLWSRIRSRFWASPYGLAYSQTLSHAEMQQALVELSFVDGAFMPQPHPSHGPDNILQNYVLKFAERLASSLSLGPRPNQIRTSARLINLIRRLTAGNGIEEKKKEMNGVGSTTDCAALHRSLNPINPPGIKADKVAGFTIQNMHTTQIDRYPSIYSAVRSVALKNNLRAPKILSFGCSVGLEAFTLAKMYFPDSAIVGTDLKEALLIEAKRNNECFGSRVQFFNSAKFPLNNFGKYDIIFANSVLCVHPPPPGGVFHTFPYTEFNKAVESLDSILKPSGLLVMVNTNYRFEDTNVSQGYYRVQRGQCHNYVPLHDATGLPHERSNKCIYQKR